MKIEHKKIFYGPSKILKNISWFIDICLKHFMTPKIPRLLNYVPFVPTCLTCLRAYVLTCLYTFFVP